MVKDSATIGNRIKTLRHLGFMYNMEKMGFVRGNVQRKT